MRFSQLMWRLVKENNRHAFFLDAIPEEFQEKFNWRKLLVDLSSNYAGGKNGSHFLCVRFTYYGATPQLSLFYEKDQVLYSGRTFQRNLNLYRYITNLYKGDDLEFMIITHPDPYFNSGNPDFVLNVPRTAVQRRYGRRGYTTPAEVVFLPRPTSAITPVIKRGGIRKVKTRSPISLKLRKVTIVFAEK